MSSMSLKRRGSQLADPLYQLNVLNKQNLSGVPEFEETLCTHGHEGLWAASVQTLQINMGKMCNQVCRHCHVDAGPDRREIMTRETLSECLAVIDKHPLSTVDLTGGAPEMNPHFEWFVGEVRQRSVRVIDRCNLTILLANGFTHLPKFLSDHGVEIVASLPCYQEDNCDFQRGDGVFERSIRALQLLNEHGYGQEGTELTLSLVYNPTGTSLPPDQKKLEADYKEQLKSRFGISFNQLFTITNMPISRFLEDLLNTGRYEDYLERLHHAFNPSAVDQLMCRTTLSVDWRGYLYDCDFNQMLELPTIAGSTRHIRDFELDRLLNRRIVTGVHCYGCTAGSGSSCQGALLSAQSPVE